ncbi:MAG: chromate efflux transporter [Isosphaeraceae bacterium]
MQRTLTENTILQPGTHRAPDQAPRGSSRPSSWELLLAFLRLGAVSFGGPAMVAYIKRLTVTRKGWLSEDDFQQGVALCQAVPGATAMQCAAYVGLRVRGLRGAVLAYIGFGLPAFLLMLSLSIAYRDAVQLQPVTSILGGLRALVVALVANATWVFGRSSVKSFREAMICLAAAALFFLGGSPFLILVGAGLGGSLLLRGPVRTAPSQESPPRTIGWAAFRPAVLVLALGAVLVLTLSLLNQQLVLLGLVMMKVDVFAFGGGFASVPLMFREIVDARNWVPPDVFMDGIALGQLTPGPIVITATFVGCQVAGLAGALVGTVCIFLPSFFAVVLAEPWSRRLRSSSLFRGATQALALSFVGLLASVTVQFAHLTAWNVPSVIIAALALAALLNKIDVLWVVLAGAVVSALLL